ncbi:MAG: hypothetical protein JXQ96_00945 [Cyclobacteriaceae bacterium]
MKKIFLTGTLGLFLAACGGKSEKQETQNQEKEVVLSAEEVQEVIKLDEASDELIEKTEELNQQLDSLINEI